MFVLQLAATRGFLRITFHIPLSHPSFQRFSALHCLKGAAAAGGRVRQLGNGARPAQPAPPSAEELHETPCVGPRNGGGRAGQQENNEL